MIMKQILYLGLRVPPNTPERQYTHYPVITIKPTGYSVPGGVFSPIIFTSPTAVQLFPNPATLQKKQLIAVGRATAAEIHRLGFDALAAQEETAEGVIEVLSQLDLEGAHALWPHSGQARTLISDYLKSQNVRCTECILYNVMFTQPANSIDLHAFDEIFFTSPSTVEGFLKIFRELPLDKCRAIGPVTEKCLTERKADILLVRF